MWLESCFSKACSSIVLEIKKSVFCSAIERCMLAFSSSKEAFKTVFKESREAVEKARKERRKNANAIESRLEKKALEFMQGFY